MAARDSADEHFSAQVDAAKLLLQRCLDDVVTERWLKWSPAFPRLGISPHSFHPCVEEAFRRFLRVGKDFPSKIASPVKWAKRKTVSELKKSFSDEPAAAVLLAKVLSFLDEVAGKQILQEPPPEERVSPVRQVPRKRNKSTLQLKREGVIFGAIQAQFRGPKYCAELDRKRLAIPAAWAEDGCPRTYGDAYKQGSPWRKRIQDQKHKFTVKYNIKTPAEREKIIEDATRRTR